MRIGISRFARNDVNWNTYLFLGRMMIKARCIVLVALLAVSISLFAQEDVIRTGTNLGVQKVRIAVPDFKPSSTQGNSSALLKTFDDTLFSDLENAGIFDVVSKSFIPATPPGNPLELCAAPGTAPAPGPLNVPAEQLRGMLGVTRVNYVERHSPLAIIDDTLG